MKIAIDLRSLSSGSISGVENYTMNVVENLLLLDKKNRFVLFYNSFGSDLPFDYHYLNSETAHSRVPNKILNLAFKLGIREVEQFTGQTDWFFMPNLNQFNVSNHTKLAITVHDLSPVVAPELYNLKRRLWHWFLNYKKAFNRANVIFAVSEYTKNDLIKLYNLPEKKIKVIYPGINRSDLKISEANKQMREARNQYSLPGKYLLFLNTIEPRKNLLNLISAFELLSDPECFLVIAGRPGWKNRKIFRKIRKSKKSNLIKYIGYLPENYKSGVIRLADALIYPSVYEGFGFQPIEAMSMGVPTIVSQVTSLPEVTGGASLLVNPYNVSDLANSLKEILFNEQFKSQLISKGFKRAENFSWKKTAATILKTLSET